jgi:hypothetical protein
MRRIQEKYIFKTVLFSGTYDPYCTTLFIPAASVIHNLIRLEINKQDFMRKSVM